MAVSGWPTHWPPEVRDHYVSRAREQQWPTSIVQAMTESVEYARALAESDRPRRHFLGVAEGARWFFEAVEVEGEQTVVRQLVVGDDGGTQHYCWQHLEDVDGELTVASLDVTHVQPIGADQFEEAWERAKAEPERGSVTIETVAWAVAVIAFVALAAAAIRAYVTAQAGRLG